MKTKLTIIALSLVAGIAGIDGVKLPFTVRHSLPGVRTITRFKEIKHNTPIEDAKFNKPAA